MVAIWVRPPLGATIDDDGVVRLSDGREFTLADIPGNGWPTGRLAKLNEAVQTLFDNVVPLADLAADDPDKTATAAELLAQYGNRAFLDGSGNIVYRSVEISFTHDGTQLIPRVRSVI